MSDYEVVVHGFWDGLGVHHETGMPAHLPMPANTDGQGPEDEDKAVSYVCWCGRECPLHVQLQKAWEAGRRAATVVRPAVTESWAQYVTRLTAGEQQDEVAERVGVAQGTVSRWMSGKKVPSDVAVIMAFATAYDRDPVEALMIAAG